MEEDFPDSPLSNEHHCFQTETTQGSLQDQSVDRAPLDRRDQSPEGHRQVPEQQSPHSTLDQVQVQVHHEETDPPDTSQDQLVVPIVDQRPTQATGEESDLSPFHRHVPDRGLSEAQQSQDRGQREDEQSEGGGGKPVLVTARQA